MRSEGNGSFQAAARPNMAKCSFVRQQKARCLWCQCGAQHMGLSSSHLHLFGPYLVIHGK